MHPLTTLSKLILPRIPTSPLNTICWIQLVFSRGGEGTMGDQGAGEPQPRAGSQEPSPALPRGAGTACLPRAGHRAVGAPQTHCDNRSQAWKWAPSLWRRWMEEEGIQLRIPILSSLVTVSFFCLRIQVLIFHILNDGFLSGKHIGFLWGDPYRSQSRCSHLNVLLY